ncbi:hypothetical protein HDV00_004241 [Rhizophlyctis rosea]|nr:hypothetical protein HDV00_004241 [Rhizophlyctis rosea]
MAIATEALGNERWETLGPLIGARVWKKGFEGADDKQRPTDRSRNRRPDRKTSEKDRYIVEVSLSVSSTTAPSEMILSRREQRERERARRRDAAKADAGSAKDEGEEREGEADLVPRAAEPVQQWRESEDAREKMEKEGESQEGEDDVAWDEDADVEGFGEGDEDGSLPSLESVVKECEDVKLTTTPTNTLLAHHFTKPRTTPPTLLQTPLIRDLHRLQTTTTHLLNSKSQTPPPFTSTTRLLPPLQSFLLVLRAKIPQSTRVVVVTCPPRTSPSDGTHNATNILLSLINFSKIKGMTYCPSAIHRIKTVQKLQATDLKIQKRSLKVDASVVRGKVVVVVDDVVGSGTTVEAVGRVCEGEGARGWYGFGVCVLRDE